MAPLHVLSFRLARAIPQSHSQAKPCAVQLTDVCFFLILTQEYSAVGPEEIYAHSHLPWTRLQSMPPASPPVATGSVITDASTVLPSGNATASPVDVRRNILHRLKLLRDEELRLKTIWNSTLPIHRLPLELLIEIFQILKATVERPHLDEWAYVDPMLWPPLTHVCRLWRHAICTTPHLWRTIHIKNYAQWVNMCLARSLSVPIEVYLHNPQTFPSVLGALSNQAHRISKLFVIDTEHETLQLLKELFKPSMPALTELCIDAKRSPVNMFCSCNTIPDDVLPALHTIRFSYTHVDWNSPILHRLRVLHLHDWDPLPEHTLTLSSFLRALEACQALEDLMIDFAFPFYTYSTDGERDVSGPIISLPNIRSVYFLCPPAEEASSPDVYHLLSHLILPPSAQVQIYTQVDSSGEGGFLATVPQDPERLPMLYHATSAELWGHAFDCNHGRDDPDRTLGHFGLSLELLSERQDPAYAPDRLLAEFCTLVARAPLRSMTFKRMAYTENAWKALFRTFPELTTLTIEGEQQEPEDGDSEQLLSALSADDADEGVFLPRLSVVHFKEMQWRASTLQGFGECLTYRAGLGTRLSELRVECFDRIREVEYDVEHDTMLAALQLLVNGSFLYLDVPRPD